uniref:Sulfotransferase family protein n=1 Tax=uncultured organism TaxID=155900 RepID=A0A7L9QC58_9ZZZZ|nr:hypothetical protein [uncultured organism]
MLVKPTEVTFVLSTTRAGSTWLGLVLGSHSWAATLGEFFRPYAIPDHVICRLCEADGLADCRVLRSLRDVPERDAHSFAAAALGTPMVVDISKRPDWAARFFDRPDLEVRLIHLVRHPAGFVESESRRSPEASLPDLCRRWEQTNRDLEVLCARSGLPAHLASYERLCDSSDTAFDELCRFLNRPFEPGALAYWTFEHHGLGGNGAASVYLRDRRIKRYVTGDDAFYRGIESRRTSADMRWRERLPEAIRSEAIASTYARELASRLGLTWSVDGYSRTALPR